MAAGEDSAAAEALLAAVAAGDAERALKGLLRSCWPRASGADEQRSEGAGSGSEEDWGYGEEEKEKQQRLLKSAEGLQPWRSWPARSLLQDWPAQVLAQGLDLFDRARDSAPWRPPAGAVSPEQLALGRGAEDALLER